MTGYMVATRVPLFRRFALGSLRALTRWGQAGHVRALYGLVPVAARDALRRRLMGAAAGSGEAAAIAAPDARAMAAPPPPVERDDGLGANLVGFVRGNLGLAENLRATARALMANGLPVDIVDADILGAARASDTAEGLAIASTARFPIDIYFVNPDQLAPALDATASARSPGTWRIGYWFWELPAIPGAWLPALDLVDEIWVASPYVADAFRAATDKPVTLVPMVVEPVPVAETAVGSGDVFRFLFSFDFHSYTVRKNPAAVLEAFHRAFPRGDEPVRLVVKTINGDVFRDAFYTLLEAAAADYRIEVRDGYVSRTGMTSLIASTDCYVSLHRAEGFGLGMAEAMALGRPVIATAHSGNLAFMTASNSLLVPFRLIPVAAGDYMHGEGQLWAEADVDAAADAMRCVSADPALAARIGAVARADLARFHSAHAAADAIITRLAAIHASLPPGPP
jgi:hypothetical protein